jgi:hypothetical protein
VNACACARVRGISGHGRKLAMRLKAAEAKLAETEAALAKQTALTDKCAHLLLPPAGHWRASADVQLMCCLYGRGPGCADQMAIAAKSCQKGTVDIKSGSAEPAGAAGSRADQASGAQSRACWFADSCWIVPTFAAILDFARLDADALPLPPPPPPPPRFVALFGALLRWQPRTRRRRARRRARQRRAQRRRSCTRPVKRTRAK